MDKKIGPKQGPKQKTQLHYTTKPQGRGMAYKDYIDNFDYIDPEYYSQPSSPGYGEDSAEMEEPYEQVR